MAAGLRSPGSEQISDTVYDYAEKLIFSSLNFTWRFRRRVRVSAATASVK